MALNRLRSPLFGLVLMMATPITLASPTLLPAIEPEPLLLSWSAEMAAALAKPNDFAARVIYSADAEHKGVWTSAGDRQIWRIAVSVPTALSMSFHAKDVHLPEGSSLILLGNGQDHDITTFVQDSGELWSDLVPGDSFELRATVPTDKVKDFKLSISEVFAGFKSLDGAVQHPAYQKAVQAQSPQATTTCETNYLCQTTAANLPASRSTVYLTVSGTTSCTGSLVNDVAGDFKNYVLTAAHCAATPATAATSVVFYYNAVTTCGTTPLPSATTATTLTTSGATHRMVFNDVWLIEANAAPPPGAYPFWIGWDASDVAPAGTTFGTHHGQARSKQYVAYTAAPAKAVDTNGNVIWQMSSTTGTTLSGSSGSNLVDPTNNLMIGTLTAGNGQCPGDAPAPINQYTRFASGFNGGGTSATASKSWLDPTSSGTTTKLGSYNPARSTATVSLATVGGQTTATTGSNVTLSWTTTNASSCTASNGWTGTKATANTSTQSQTVTSGTAGPVTYTLTCAGEPNTDAKSVTVTYQAATAGASSGGGGGALDLSMLAGLLLLLMARKELHLNNGESS